MKTPTYRRDPRDLSPAKVTEVIYLASVQRQPVVSVALETGVSVEAIQHYVSRYEEREETNPDQARLFA